MSEQLNKAIEILKESGPVCVVVKGEEVFTATDKGIKPLITWLREDPKFFQGASIADKVIGKAAAMLMVYGGAKEVYAGVLSEASAEFLTKEQIPFTCKERVPYIINRDKTDMCPMEKRARGLQTPKEAFDVFNEIVK